MDRKTQKSMMDQEVVDKLPWWQWRTKAAGQSGQKQEPDQSRGHDSPKAKTSHEE